MKTPAVSVVISIYNGEQYLPECLESILAQTLENIEIICVDDASTDATVSYTHLTLPTIRLV